jgi:hypothetical protein
LVLSFLFFLEFSSNSICNHVRDNAGHNEIKNGNADDRAENTAAPHVDFPTQGRADKLFEQFARIQGEENTADGRWQERHDVGLITSGSNFVVSGILDGHNINLQASLTIESNFAILVLSVQGHVEVPLIVFFPLEYVRLVFLQHMFVVVVFVKRHKAFAKRAIFERLGQVQLVGANNLIWREEVAIVALNSQRVLLARNFNLVDKTIVERRLSILTAEMSISFQRVFI